MSSLAIATRDRLPPRERRGDLRYRCHRICHARPNGTALGVSWGVTLLNLSAQGMLLELRQPLPVGVLLAVQPASVCPAAPLLARVLRVTAWEPGRWLCGCVLLEPLSAEDLQEWRCG